MAQHLSVSFIVYAIDAIEIQGYLNCSKNSVLYFEEKTKQKNKAMKRQNKERFSLSISTLAYAKIDGMCLGKVPKLKIFHSGVLAV